MSALLAQAQQMQQQLMAAQQRLIESEVHGEAGGGLVKVRLTAKGEMKGVTIDPSLLKPEESEIVEDLVLAAHNDARAKGDRLTQDKMGSITAGLPIPPGMKLPF